MGGFFLIRYASPVNILIAKMKTAYKLGEKGACKVHFPRTEWAVIDQLNTNKTIKFEFPSKILLKK